MEIKKFFSPFEYKFSNEDEGSFEGHAAIFNVADRMDDIIIKGAFKKSLHKHPAKKIKMLLGHDLAAMVGVWDEVKEDSKGLAVKGHLLMQLQSAQDTMVLLKEGVLDSMSIGFMTLKSQFDEKRDGRDLLEIDLFEISLVAIPAQPGALVTSVKSVSPEDIVTKRDLERALREADFSVSTSKFITAGWTPPARRDVEGGNDELVASIRRVTENVKTATGT